MIEDIKNNIDINEERLLLIQRTLQVLTETLSKGLGGDDITLLHADIVYCMNSYALDLFGDDEGRKFLRESFDETFAITDFLSKDASSLQ